jgi:hypothetical protein
MVRFDHTWDMIRDILFPTTGGRDDQPTPARRIIRTERLEPRLLFAVHNDSFDVTQLTQLRSDPAFSAITGSGIGIAILDTGVDALNPDLSSKVEAYYNAVEDPIPTSISSSSVSSASDNEGHGTHTSGIAASADPNIGVAYGSGLVDVKVLADSGESQLSGDPLLRGLQFVQDFAGQFNIKVVSMSIGESNSNGGLNLNSVPAADDISREIQTLESLGITVVSAAGNSYANDPVPGESYPAVVSTISVASTWSDTGAGNDFDTYSYGSSNDSWAAVESSATPDQFSATSQRSTLPNQVVAPGVNIYSDWNGSSTDNSGSDLLHNTLSGTSMATPFVAGLVALMQDAAFTFGGRYITNPQQVLDIIKATADVIQDPTLAGDGRVPISNGQLTSSTVSPLPGTGDSYDRVNVYKAIQAVKSLFTGTISNADTDNTTATATAVPDLNGTAVFTENGSIGTDGLNQVGTNDVDLYKLVLDSPGTLSGTLSQPNGGTAFTASLQLFDSAGNSLGKMDGTSSNGYPTFSTTNPLAAGTYYLGVSSLGNDSYSITDGSGAAGGGTTGDYSLSLSLSNPDPNGVPQGAQAVDLTNPNTTLSGNIVASEFQGDLGSDPPPTGSDTRIQVPNGDVDMFKIIAPDTGIVTADVSATIFGFNGADSYVSVFDNNLNQITADGRLSSFASNSAVQFSVTVGQTYYVAVTVDANRNFSPSDPFSRLSGSTSPETNYTLDLSFDNGNTDGTALLAQSANIGQTVNGKIGSSDPSLGSNGGSKYVDWYTYTASAAGLLDLAATATSSGFAPSLGLWTLSADHSSISEIGSITGSGSHLIDQVSAGQTVYVSATGQGNSNFNWFSLGSGSGGQTGTYSLASALRPLSDLKSLNDGSINNGTPQTLTAGHTVSGNIGMYNGLIIGSTDVDLYKFVPTSTGLFDIRTDTSQEGSADTLLRLFDANGNQIAQNDNASSATTASFIRTNLIAGQTYYIGVSGSGNAAYNPVTGSGKTAAVSTGNYVLAVNPATTPAISVANAATVPQPTDAAPVEATFTVSLDFPINSAITVHYSTADNTAIAGTDYTAVSGTLTFPAGTTSQTISVPVLADPSASGNLTFFLNLSSPSSNATLAGGQATGTITTLPVQNLALGNGAKAKYRDAAGRKVAVQLLGPGSGQVSVIGSGSSEVVQIVVNDSTDASRLVISDAGSLTTISELQINGSLANLSAPRVDLEGDITITGTIKRLTLAKAGGGHTLSIDGTGSTAALSLGDVSDLTVSTAEPIASLVAKEWLDTGPADTITAPSIERLKTTGVFAAGLNLNGGGVALGSAKIGGGIASGTWTIDGSADQIITASTTAAWAATFSGAITSLVINGSAGGLLTAESIGTLRVKKDLSQASITLTGNGTDLNKLRVGRTVDGSDIRSAGDINTVKVGTIVDSTIFAGVDPSVTGLPTDLSAFLTPSEILSFVVTGLPGSTFAVTNSVIAAESLGTVKVRRVNPSNNGIPFGFAAQSLATFTDIEPGQRPFRWTANQSPSDLTFPGDFKVELL